MKHTGGIILTVLLLAMMPGTVLSQDAVFSQYYASALYLNPALAGVEREIYLGANNRSQWNKLALPFNTFQVSFIQPVYRGGARKKHIGGVGVSMLNDVAGANKEFVTRSLSIAGAYNIQLNGSDRHVLSVALQSGVSQQRINFENLKWSTQYSTDAGFDPTMPGESGIQSTSVFRPLLNLGVMWSYTLAPSKSSVAGTTFYNGIAVSNLVRSGSHFSGEVSSQSVVFKSHGGFTKTISPTLEISPNYLVQVQGAHRQINLGMYLGYLLPGSASGKLRVTGGAWYRVQDGLIFSTGLAAPKWNIGFSYDNNLVSLEKAFGYASAYEFSMAYRIPNKNNFRRISSPLI